MTATAHDDCRTCDFLAQYAEERAREQLVNAYEAKLETHMALVTRLKPVATYREGDPEPEGATRLYDRRDEGYLALRTSWVKQGDGWRGVVDGYYNCRLDWDTLTHLYSPLYAY